MARLGEVTFIGIYRPSTSHSRDCLAAFLAELLDLLATITTPHVVVGGDFNIHFDVPSAFTVHFIESVAAFGIISAPFMPSRSAPAHGR